MSAQHAPQDPRLHLVALHAGAFVDRFQKELAGLYTVIACEPDLDRLLELCAALSPEAVFADQEFPGGLSPADRTKLFTPPVPLLLVGTREDAAAAVELVRWGAAGLLHPDAAKSEILEAIGAVRRGELWLRRAVLSELIKDAFRPSDLRPLTRRELEILDLLSPGANNQQIADRLCISRATLRWHLRNIYSKLAVTGREAALRHPAARRVYRP